ncbi:hypothetical protein FRC03_010954 [Tulasnella sp. 419]|nr:hypothetical protein FRC03_010954 [Tulasnella sp. 419]
MGGSCQTFYTEDSSNGKSPLAKLCLCGCLGLQHYNSMNHAKEPVKSASKGGQPGFTGTATTNIMPEAGASEKIRQGAHTTKNIFSEAARERKERWNQDASVKFSKSTNTFNPAGKMYESFEKQNSSGKRPGGVNSKRSTKRSKSSGMSSCKANELKLHVLLLPHTSAVYKEHRLTFSNIRLLTVFKTYGLIIPIRVTSDMDPERIISEITQTFMGISTFAQFVIEQDLVP